MNYLDRWTPASRKPFPSYTVPGLQLRLLLMEAREHHAEAGEGFTLTYEILPGVTGDEAWRKRAVAATVQLEEEPAKGRRKCRVRRAGDLLWAPCADDELPMLPPPRGPHLKFLYLFAYPIDEALDELPCVD